MDPTPFLVRLAGMDFRWGQTDCALAVADYWLWATGRNADPAEGIRGTYSTERECVAVLETHGGLLRIFSRLARDYDLPRCRGEYPAGAIGVIRLPGQNGRATHYGAIRTPSGRWAVKGHEGVAFLSGVRVAAAWAI